MRNKKFLIVKLFYIFFYPLVNTYAYEINTNSIIKIFCLENVKAELAKNGFKPKINFEEEVCDCYIDNISRNISHDDSISECKIETKEKYNLK